MLKMKFGHALYNACPEAIEWLEETGYTLLEAWLHCRRADWMLWLLSELGMSSQQDFEFQLLMLQTPLADGRVVLDLITDERSLAFIELKRKCAADKIVSEADKIVSETKWAAARTVDRVVFSAEAADVAWAAEAADAAWVAVDTDAAWVAAVDTDAADWQVKAVLEVIPDLQVWHDSLQESE